jgi:hypothetical protein
MLWNIFLDSRKPHFSKSALCGSRWASKTPAVPDSYKRCTPWLELETCCAHLKPFVITLRPLGTMLWNMLPLYNAYKAKSLKNIFFLTFHNKVIKKKKEKIYKEIDIKTFMLGRYKAHQQVNYHKKKQVKLYESCSSDMYHIVTKSISFPEKSF